MGCTVFDANGYTEYGGLNRVQIWTKPSVHHPALAGPSASNGDSVPKFVHPKTLHLPSEMLPVILKKIQTRIQALVGYGCDLFIAHNTSSIPLWRKGSALDADGLEFLMSRGNEWYARRTHERTVKPGDRIAVLGRAIALVEQVSAGHVRAKLWNKTVLMIGRKCIRWDEQRDRRISVGHASVNQLSGAIMSQDGGVSEERIAALLTRMSMPPRCASSG